MLIEWLYPKEEINLDLLSEELVAVLGTDLVGISIGGDRGQVRVHVQADTPPAMQDQVGTIIAAHDAAQMTAEQRTRADQVAQLAALDQKAWTEWTTQDKDLLLRLLAERTVSALLAQVTA